MRPCTWAYLSWRPTASGVRRISCAKARPGSRQPPRRHRFTQRLEVLVTSHERRRRMGRLAQEHAAKWTYEHAAGGIVRAAYAGCRQDERHGMTAVLLSRPADVPQVPDGVKALRPSPRRAVWRNARPRTQFPRFTELASSWRGSLLAAMASWNSRPNARRSTAVSVRRRAMLSTPYREASIQNIAIALARVNLLVSSAFRCTWTYLAFLQASIQSHCPFRPPASRGRAIAFYRAARRPAWVLLARARNSTPR